jgi:nucleoside-diphosphate-sugar epimerase
MKVLLIGGSGYIGSYATWYLSKRGFDPVVYDLLEPILDCEFVKGDMRDIRKLTYIAGPCAAVVIMGGVIGDPAGEANPKLADELNHKAVAEICNECSEKHVIFFSTAGVYGAQDEQLHENSPVIPISVYARTKLAGENHVRAIEGTIFRLGSVYGLGMDGRFRLDSIVNILTMKAVTEGRFTILGGSQWKALISVRDVACYLEEAICRITGTYNIFSRNYTLSEIGEHIVKCLPGTEITYGDMPVNDRNYQLDGSKKLADFKFDSKYGIDEEILRLAEYFKNSRHV